MNLWMLALQVSFQICGVSVLKTLAAMLAFAATDILVFSRIEDFNLIKLLVNMTEVDPGSLALWC